METIAKCVGHLLCISDRQGTCKVGDHSQHKVTLPLDLLTHLRRTNAENFSLRAPTGVPGVYLPPEPGRPAVSAPPAPPWQTPCSRCWVARPRRHRSGCLPPSPLVTSGALRREGVMPPAAGGGLPQSEGRPAGGRAWRGAARGGGVEPPGGVSPRGVTVGTPAGAVRPGGRAAPPSGVVRQRGVASDPGRGPGGAGGRSPGEARWGHASRRGSPVRRTL